MSLNNVITSRVASSVFSSISYAIIFIVVKLLDFGLSYKINKPWATGLIFSASTIALLILLFIFGDKMVRKKKEKEEDIIDLNAEMPKIKEGKIEVKKDIDKGLIIQDSEEVSNLGEDVPDEDDEEQKLKSNIKKQKQELEKAQKEYLKFKGVL